MSSVHDDTAKRVFEIVANHSCNPVRIDASIWHDLGVYGDDAWELLAQLHEALGVSFDGFHFNDYFPSETFLCSPVNKSRYRQITVQELIEFVSSGLTWRKFKEETL